MQSLLWNADDTETLIRLWDDPANTESSIAITMGRTRSSIAGRIKRLRKLGMIPKRKENYIRKPRQQHGGGTPTRKPNHRKPSVRVMLLQQAETESPPTQPCGLVELENWHCRWPIGDPVDPDFKFCCDHTVEGYSYCARHCLTAYNISTLKPA